MLVLYSLLYTLSMLLMSPLFLLRRQKYASGFSERLGNYPKFDQDSRKVVWLHCVSVGETNAARPLVDELVKQFPAHRLVVSNTTKTGHDLANKVFAGKADAVFYLPFDWKFSVRRALNNYHPDLLLLMETEIWPRLIVEAKRTGAKVAIVNGRLSQRSFERYSKIDGFVQLILKSVDCGLMQSNKDAERIESLGLDANKIEVTGNLKFDISSDGHEKALSQQFRERFRLDGSRPLVIAASTHEPEEKLILRSLNESLRHDARLMIAPRHPERFDEVAELIKSTRFRTVRRSDKPSERDRSADIILLDSIGELRAAFSLASIVFVGGSLIPHGGQSILEPALFGTAMVTGPHTHNFNDVVKLFIVRNALIQLPETQSEDETVQLLTHQLENILHDRKKRDELGSNALAVMEANRGATAITIAELVKLIDAA